MWSTLSRRCLNLISHIGSNEWDAIGMDDKGKKKFSSDIELIGFKEIDEVDEVIFKEKFPRCGAL